MDPAIRALFSPAPGVAYLDSATYGLPPEPTARAMRTALAAWQAGTADWVSDWDRPAEAARVSFADIVGVAAADVAFLPSVSVGVGIVASTLGPGDEVVVPTDEFRSVLFPLLVARERGARIREVPLEAIADEIRPGTTLVAATVVQMQSGRVVDVQGIVERAGSVGARVLLDATHAIPFVPLAHLVPRADYVLAAAYKHLLCPRGVAFMTVRPDRLTELPPHNANWRTSDRPWDSFFGGPLALPDTAARLDVSLAWLPWVAAIESLRLISGWSASGVLDEPVALARALAEELGLPWGGASLVCAPVADGEAVRAVLREAGVKAAVRGTAIRLSTHVYNDRADVDRAVDALRSFVEPEPAQPSRAGSS
ncbi:MAG TPA: aminotransferase class V-fold PLP-dependent enzyme [Candidatus Limnocylindrales bacterium]